MTYVKQRKICSMNCVVGNVAEVLEKELWRIWSDERVGEWAMTYVKQRKGCRMSYDVCEAMEGL